MTNLTQAQIDRYNAFEAMLDMMDPTATYSRDEIKVTIEQIVEMAVEDREAEAPVQETYLDRYSDKRTQEFTNQELLAEADRLENKGLEELDTIDNVRYSFVKTELRYRANIGVL